MTEKLFWTDPYCKEFSATVLAQFPVENGFAVELDRTCFYATSGGQPNDTGSLNSVRVTDVRMENDRLLHILAEPLGHNQVTGRIDWNRRSDHMQQHSGQHVLSAAFFRLFGAQTSSFHLGEEYCSIELSKEDLSEKEVLEAEKLANQVVTTGVDVEAILTDADDAQKYELRKQSDLKESLRLIRIGDFDISPCSGTHVKNTSEIGNIFVLGQEKAPRAVKVSFVCGDRIRDRYRRDLSILKKLSRSLTTSIPLLPDSVATLQTQLKELRKENEKLKEIVLKAEAVDLLMQARDWKEHHLIVSDVKRPYQEMRYIAQRLTEQPKAIGAIFSATESRVIFFKNTALNVDLRSIFRRFQEQTGAKGGGAPHFVEAGNVTVDERLVPLLIHLFEEAV